MSRLEEGRAREGWGWHSLLSSTSATIQEKNPLFPWSHHVHHYNSRSESKHWIHVTDGRREGFLWLMGRGLQSSFQSDPPELRTGYPVSMAVLEALRYLHWFMRLPRSRSIADYRSTSAGGLMREDRPGLGFCSKCSSWKEGRIKSNPKTRRLTSVVREMGSCRSQR